MDINETIAKIHSVLSDDLLKPEYRNIPNKHITTGHCYVASEAIFHLFGGKAVWKAKSGRDSANGTHWWLVHKETGLIVDPTKEQYIVKGEIPPYEKGKACGFLTKDPSKRCQILLERLA